MPIPQTMSAVQLMGHGGLDELVHSDDVPVASPAAGEVLIDVHACGMNNTDVWVREGAYGSDTDPSEVHLAARPLHTRVPAHPGRRHRGPHRRGRSGRRRRPRR